MTTVLGYVSCCTVVLRTSCCTVVATAHILLHAPSADTINEEQSLPAEDQDHRSTSPAHTDSHEKIRSNADKVKEKQSLKEDDEAELQTYAELHSHLSCKTYPVGSSKAEKAVIRKRAKHFELVAGVLHYKDKAKSDGCQCLRQVYNLFGSVCILLIAIVYISMQVNITNRKTKHEILMACHNDNVRGGYFGHDVRKLHPDIGRKYMEMWRNGYGSSY